MALRNAPDEYEPPYPPRKEEKSKETARSYKLEYDVPGPTAPSRPRRGRKAASSASEPPRQSEIRRPDPGGDLGMPDFLERTPAASARRRSAECQRLCYLTQTINESCALGAGTRTFIASTCLRLQ